MHQSIQPIREFSTPDHDAIRREVIGSEQPAVLRGLVSGWPVVDVGRRSPAAVIEYLRRFDNGSPVDAIMTPPEIEGRVFYDDAMNGFNFVRNRLPITAVAEQVLRYAAFARSPAVAAQSALIRDCLPGFSAENPLTVIDGTVRPHEPAYDPEPDAYVTWDYCRGYADASLNEATSDADGIHRRH